MGSAFWKIGGLCKTSFSWKEAVWINKKEKSLGVYQVNQKWQYETNKQRKQGN